MSLPLPNYRYWHEMLEKIAVAHEAGNKFLTDEYNQGLFAYCVLGLNNAKIFEIDKDISKLLTMTTNVVRETKLPFPLTFLETTFDLHETRYYGILLIEFPEVLKFLPIKEVLKQKAYRSRNHEIVTISIVNYRGHSALISGPLFTRKPKIVADEIKGFKTISADLKTIIMNFLDFLYEPEVEWVTATRIKFIRRELSKKRIILPVSKVVKVKGKLKRYLRELRKGKAFAYSHKFWVRGHWRHFRSSYYKEKRGAKKWIPPYIKGQGILIKKIWHIQR